MKTPNNCRWRVTKLRNVADLRFSSVFASLNSGRRKEESERRRKTGEDRRGRGAVLAFQSESFDGGDLKAEL